MTKEVIFFFGRCFELESMSYFLFYMMHEYILSLFHYSLFYCSHFILFDSHEFLHHDKQLSTHISQNTLSTTVKLQMCIQDVYHYYVKFEAFIIFVTLLFRPNVKGLLCSQTCRLWNSLCGIFPLAVFQNQLEVNILTGPQPLHLVVNVAELRNNSLM